VDESPLIEALVHELGIPSVRMAVDRCAALAPGLRFLQEWELPLGPANHFVWEQLLRREAAEGIQLTLNGQGGDELFGAPVYLFADRIAHGRVAAAYELTRRIPGVGPDPPASIRRRAMRLWGLRGALPHRLHLAAWRRRALERHAPPLLSPEGARVYLDSHDPYPWKRTPGPRWRAERLDLLTDGADGMGVFDYLRRRAAGAGVESREPLLDVDLIGLMMRIPPELSFDPALSRPVLREAVGALLPDSIRLRSEKSAFDQVLTDALTGADLPALRHILESPSAEVRAWVRPELVRETVLERPPEVHPGGADGWSKVAWRLLGLECWLRTQEDASFPARALDSLALEEPRCTFRAAGVRVPAGAR
jgi:asparagine synthetase B (glutamine-hydrolysing)